ncbi:MAG: type I DNA topoisomerase [Actinomycetota bacterium]
MAKNLVVVESPAKAKTIEKYMGKDYKVLASMGHVRDLPKSDFAIECNGNVSITYEAITRANAKKAVSAIRKELKEADAVWLAPDPDREGEAIAWHVAELLKIGPDKRKRVTFNEITKKAVTAAFENPRDIDMNLVDAQQARRAVDRIVGYKLSPLLWRNVGPNLSAGRVQSAALLLVVMRERERRAFKETEYWDITARLATKKKEEFTAMYPASQNKEKPELGTEDSAKNLVERVEPGPWTVKEIRKSERKSKPPAPFKTSTLQQAGSSRLGFPVWKTMKVAQTLYEAGHITYMRTDSTNLSNDALGEIGRTVETMFGNDYHQVRKFQEKTKGAQEAHEAIRPASASNDPSAMAGALNKDELRLYEIIWQRTMASQMTEAVYDQTSVDIESNGAIFRATGKVLKFDGYMRVYLEQEDDDESEETAGLLPTDLAEGDVLDLRELVPAQHFTQPPPRYTEATLVREMEKQGIGRPSTYSPTIKTIEDRDYIRVESRRLFPTTRGEVVTELLEKHFNEIVDLEFTARMEEDLDEIAEGAKEMQPLVCGFLASFTAHVEEQGGKMSRPEQPTDMKCPECGRPVSKKFGKHGLWFLSCTGFGEKGEDGKPVCRWSQQLDEEGNPLADPEGTGEECPQCGNELVAKTGRFGPFVGCSNYPDCKYIKKEPPKETGEQCPQCGNPLVEKRGRFGPFTGCSNYPECKYIKKKPKKTAAASTS